MKTITDGSAVFVVRDKRMQAIVDMFYPIGSITPIILLACVTVVLGSLVFIYYLFRVIFM